MTYPKYRRLLLSDSQFSPQDELFMRRAMELAEQAEAEGEVPVGAVLVKETQFKQR